METPVKPDNQAAVDPVVQAQTRNERTVPLEYPVSIGEGQRAFTLTEVFFPEVHEVESWMLLEPLEFAHGNGQTVQHALLANITGHPYALIKKIKLPDFSKFQPFLNEYKDPGNVS